MISLIAISYLSGLAALFDMTRRPLAAWQRADRDRGHWWTYGIILTIIALGLFFALAYLTLVIGRFSNNPSSGGDFNKNDFGR